MSSSSSFFSGSNPTPTEYQTSVNLVAEATQKALEALQAQTAAAASAQSAQNYSVSAGEAATSATNQASSAASSAAGSANSATAASTSATNAATSATNAASSASAASTSATNAANSATAASTSAANAANSAAAAATSEANAASTLASALTKSDNLASLTNVATARSNLGLSTLSTTTPGTGVATALGANVGSAGAFVTNGGALGTPSSGNLANCTFPTLNQNTTGTAAGLSATLNVASGGTGLTSLTAGRIPFGNGTSALGSSSNLFWDGSRLLLGSTTAQAGGAGLIPNLQLHGTTNDTSTYGVFGWGSAVTPFNQYNKSNSTTIGTYSIVSNGAFLGEIGFAGDDGTAFARAASIRAIVASAPATGSMPGALVFNTTPSGSTTPTERLRIDSSGNVGIGATTSASITLRVNKNITGGTTCQQILSQGVVQSDVTFAARGFQTFLGTANATFTLAELTHYFVAQDAFGASSTVTDQYGFNCGNITGATNNYGFYSNIASGTGRWNFYANGTAANYFAGPVQFSAGTASAPALSRFGDTNTGIFFPAADTIAFAEGGVETMRLDSSGNVGIGTSSFGTSAATVIGIANGTAPTTGPADTIQIYSTDLSAGNTMLSIYTEGTPVNANTTAAATHRIAIRVNGTVYYLLANTSA